jgi:hypothetical protein
LEEEFGDDLEMASARWQPSSMELVVMNRTDKSVVPPNQPLAWGYLLEDEYLLEAARDVPIPTAIMTILEPSLDYRYGIRWNIPDDVAERKEANKLAQIRFDWREQMRKRNGRATLTQFLDLCRKMLALPKREKLYAGFYAINEETHCCELIASVGCPGEVGACLSASEPWGKGPIGRAARRFEVIQFEGSRHEPVEGQPSAPKECSVLLATGLAYDGLKKQLPAATRIFGVIALGSTDKHSRLLSLTDESALANWVAKCQTWGNNLLNLPKR